LKNSRAIFCSVAEAWRRIARKRGWSGHTTFGVEVLLTGEEIKGFCPIDRDFPDRERLALEASQEESYFVGSGGGATQAKDHCG
jgi:hypothetical protein